MPLVNRRILLIGLAAILLLAAVVTFVRGRAGDERPPAPIATSSAVVDGAGGVVPAAEEKLVVDVTGAVRRPGVYRLVRGARVEDAVKAAGGVTRRADAMAINLAALLVDGEQVFVPEAMLVPAGAVAPLPAEAGNAGAGTTIVHLNNADAAALEALPGVGPVTAERIVAWRDAHGGFRSVDDLLEVPGIGPAKLEQMRAFVAP